MLLYITGGSMGNLYGISVARYQKFPDIKEKGIYSLKKPLCLFTSDKVSILLFVLSPYETIFKIYCV